jgi:iron(III) transport system permease protein
VNRVSGILGGLTLAFALLAVVGWPVIVTVLEAVRSSEGAPGPGPALDLAASAEVLRETGGLKRPVRLALESIRLVLATEAIALPVGISVAFLLFRTDLWGRRPFLLVVALAAFIPLPLHATAWLGALGNVGRAQVLGIRPVLVGRVGAAVVHALAALPWVVVIAGAGLCAVEAELEESALLESGPLRVVGRVTMRRAIGAIAAAALAVAVLTGGDMTVTDLLQIRTYAEEAYLQYVYWGNPAAAAGVALPPMIVLGALIVVVGRTLGRLDPARLVSPLAGAREWRLGNWRVPLGLVLLAFAGNMVAFPIYGLIWRAGRVSGRATLGLPPEWSFGGLTGTLRFAASEIEEPLVTSLVWGCVSTSVTILLAYALAWSSRQSQAWRIAMFTTIVVTLATPGSVAGVALVMAYNPIPVIADSPVVLVMAYTLRSLPYALLVLWPFVRSFPQDYLDAAALDGHGPWGQMIRIALPLSARAITAAWAVAFALALGELPATNVVVPAGISPMSREIWGLLHTGVESHLAGVALIMLGVIAAAGLAAVFALAWLRAVRS